MKVLITGGAGFIGSHLVLHWLEQFPNDSVCNLDKLTYAANPDYLKGAEKNPRYSFVQADVTDRKQVRECLQRFEPEGIIHLAAETHVDNSIAGPEPFVVTNLVGTFNLLEEVRQLWSSSKQTFPSKRFHHISTDEVYGTLGATGAFSETTPYQPNSPYSASKAGSDHLVRAYAHTFGMNTVITNCSNNFGPHQHAEKLIPTMIRTALAKRPMPVYGKGTNVRDWLYVKDHCSAIAAVFRSGKSGESYNIGARNEWKNLDLVTKICELLNEMVGEGPEGDYKNLIHFVTDRLGHDFRYAIDSTKIEQELGWRASQDFTADLRETVSWYVTRYRN